MQPFRQLTAIAVPLDRANVDTDQIIPKQFLKNVLRSGLGKGLFFDWRYLPDGDPNPEFVLNRPEYRGAGILLARENFGCGSSREHAPWALKDFGIQALIAPSFADIFYNNCLQNGMLPISLPGAEVDRLFQVVSAAPGTQLSINLEKQHVSTPHGETFAFELDAYQKQCLLEGWDSIALTLRHEDEIAAFEARG